MPAKFDPTAITYVYVHAYGGEPPSSAVLAPKLGPLGIPPKKAADEIVKATKDWKGVRVTVELTIQNRQISCKIINTSSSLLLMALKEPLRDRKKVKNIKHSGNLNFEAVLDIARQMRESAKGIPSRTLQGSVMEVLGTADSIGCTVNGKRPKALQEDLRSGALSCPAA